MRLLTANEQKAFDAFCVEQGYSIDDLMERAGTALVSIIVQAFMRLDSCFETIDLFIGPGMNGGDLYVAAKWLHEKGFPINIFEVSAMANLNSDAVQFRKREQCLVLGLVPMPLSKYQPRRSLIVDGLLGSGFTSKRKLSDELADALEKMQTAKTLGAYIIACDLPSGIDATTGYVSEFTVPADETVTFVAPKLGQFSAPGHQYNGKLHISDLDLPSRIQEQFFKTYDTAKAATAQQLRDKLQEPRSDTHKWQQGNLLVLAGSHGMAGSLAFAVQAACRTGLGLVHVLAEETVYPLAFTFAPEAIYYTYRETELETLIALAEAQMAKASAVLIGPGLGRGEKTKALLKLTLPSSKPLLIDADGLSVLAEYADLQDLLRERYKLGRPTILTPHAGEANRLATNFINTSKWAKLSRLEQIACLAEYYPAHIVLKGERSLITSPGNQELYVNTSGGIGLAKAGSGDVLAGIIAGLLAQGYSAIDAATIGTYWHGIAGDLATQCKHWRTHRVSDTIDFMGQALQRIEALDKH